MSKEDRKIDLIPGESKLTVVAQDEWVVIVGQPPIAAMPLDVDQARKFARMVLQCAQAVEDEQRGVRARERIAEKEGLN